MGSDSQAPELAHGLSLGRGRRPPLAWAALALAVAGMAGVTGCLLRPDWPLALPLGCIALLLVGGGVIALLRAVDQAALGERAAALRLAQQAFEAVTGGVLIKDAELRYVWANPHIAGRIGRRPDE